MDCSGQRFANHHSYMHIVWIVCWRCCVAMTPAGLSSWETCMGTQLIEWAAAALCLEGEGECSLAVVMYNLWLIID